MNTPPLRYGVKSHFGGFVVIRFADMIKTNMLLGDVSASGFMSDFAEYLPYARAPAAD